MVQVANSSLFRSQGRSASSREPSQNTPPPSPGPRRSSVLAPKPPRASSIRQALELPMIRALRIVSNLFLPQGLCPCCFLCLYLSDMPNAHTLTLFMSLLKSHLLQEGLWEVRGSSWPLLVPQHGPGPPQPPHWLLLPLQPPWRNQGPSEIPKLIRLLPCLTPFHANQGGLSKWGLLAQAVRPPRVLLLPAPSLCSLLTTLPRSPHSAPNTPSRPRAFAHAACAPTSLCSPLFR